MFDALLLGVKRIGHGVHIANNPYLIDMIIENDVGLEICPISNYILGYTLDLRWHPIKILMKKGVAVTISSDDPTFWDYSELSLDYSYAFLAWELDLKDLKQLAINSIKQSSVDHKLKPNLFKRFYKDWDSWIGKVIRKNQI